MIKPTTAKLISRLEQEIEYSNRKYIGVNFTNSEVTTLIQTIRELEAELAKKKHHKPRYDERQKARYYAPE